MWGAGTTERDLKQSSEDDVTSRDLILLLWQLFRSCLLF